ncbi:MAG: metallophosphatase, partial [Candidatus Riflebacteria bacterium]
MKFKYRNRKALLPFFALVFSLILPLQILAASAELIIFHTSDTHGSIAAHADPTAKDEPRPLIGGFAVLKKLMDTYREDPANSKARIMYLDSGDFFQGTPVVDRTKGAVMIDFMNRIGVEATTLGNHEFDYSYENLVEQMEKAQFPVICCNVFEKATGRLVPFAEPYRVLAHQGFKIGIIGVDTPETPSISVEKNIKDLDFRAPEPIVQKIADRLRASGVDFIILLSHLGYESDLEFVEKVRGIDLI